jgi:hypothetical protein
MSEFLTSLVMRVRAPELAVRPRSSTSFDSPGRAPGWEVSAPDFEAQPLQQRIADETEANAAPVNGSVLRRASAPAGAVVGEPPTTFETRAVDPAETAAVNGAAGQRASATVAARDDEHQRLRSSPTVEPPAINPADTKRPTADRSMIASPALTANGVHPADKIRAWDKAVSEDIEARPAAGRVDRAPGGARTSRRDSSLPIDRKIREMSDRSHDRSSEGPAEVHVALQSSDGARSNRGQAAPSQPDLPSRFVDGLSSAPFEAAELNGVLPRKHSENDPGRGEAIEPGSERPMQPIEVSQIAEAVRPDRSTAGQPPVLATRSRSADVEAPTSMPTHSRLGASSRREDESRDRQAAPVSPATIHVTIGRIEVRAATATEPRTKPRPASASPSLDDYLRQRSGRSRS